MKYTYHRLEVNKKEFEAFKAKSDKGICPFCNKRIARNYGGLDKHLRACIEKLKK